ncbi:MAG: tetratricopeptide repeat protein [Flavobacteriaceae bacterium]|nr:tetratricopeptide repeat protein [Flavobacteriaceae bacterium]
MLIKYFFSIFILIQSLSAQTPANNKFYLESLNDLKNIDSTIVYYKNSLNTISDKKSLLEINFNLGRIYKSQNKNYLLAKKYFNQAKILAIKLDDQKKLAKIYLKLGLIFYQRESDSTLHYYKKSLFISKKIKDNWLISIAYSNIASLAIKEKDYKTAKAYFQKSIDIGKKSNRNLTTVYNNFGILYEGINIDTAIYYHKKSLKIAKAKKAKKYITRSYINIGVSYLESYRFDKAYQNLLKGEKIAKEIKEKRYLYYINSYYGKYYFLKGNNKKAKFYYDLVLNSKYSKIESLHQIDVLNQLFQLYETDGDYKKAISYQKQYYQLKDSIYSIQKNKSYKLIKTKYRVADKDRKIILLTKEKEIEEVNKKYVILVSIIVFTFLLFLTNMLRNKIKTQKLLRNKEQKLFEQEIQTKKVLSLIEGQENERKRLSKELHDGLGGQLSGIKSITQTITDTNLYEKKRHIDIHLTNAIKNLRNISHDLSANFLEKTDFNFLIKQLISKSFKVLKINFETSVFPSKKINELPIHYKLNIYRIIQETTQNIIKHAKAKNVSISLVVNNEINLLIEDDGVGFEVSNFKGIGLQNIKDRVQSMYGTFNIDSLVKKGTTININIPYL